MMVMKGACALGPGPTSQDRPRMVDDYIPRSWGESDHGMARKVKSPSSHDIIPYFVCLACPTRTTYATTLQARVITVVRAVVLRDALIRIRVWWESWHNIGVSQAGIG
jgi:hypothetical protein